MKSFQNFAQNIQSAPVFQKLRAFEQKRMTNVSTRHQKRKEYILKIDQDAKQDLRDSIKAQAKDFQEFVDMLLEQHDNEQNQENDK